MTKITESGGNQDIKSAEPPSNIESTFIDYPKDAEKVNGRWAMLGLVALFGAYASTGQIIPGIFQGKITSIQKINKQQLIHNLLNLSK